MRAIRTVSEHTLDLHGKGHKNVLTVYAFPLHNIWHCIIAQNLVRPCKVELLRNTTEKFSV